MRLHIETITFLLIFACLMGFIGNTLYALKDTRAVVYAVLTK